MSLKGRVKRLEHAVHGEKHMEQVIKRMWLRAEIQFHEMQREWAAIDRDYGKCGGGWSDRKSEGSTVAPGPLSEEAQQLLLVDTEELRQSDQRAWDRYAKVNGITSPRGADGFLFVPVEERMRRYRDEEEKYEKPSVSGEITRLPPLDGAD